ncbi:hypothetical protein [Plantactinospora sp. DSM 117369]
MQLQRVLRRVFRIDRVRRTHIPAVRETAFARPLGTGAGPAAPE